MAKKRFNKNEIQEILHQYEKGVSINTIIEEYGISQATFYNWKAKFGKYSSNVMLELNKLKDDNDKLKRMFADLSLENAALKSKLKRHS